MENLNLTLPEKKTPAPKPARLVLLLLVCVLGVGVANLVVLLRAPSAGASSAVTSASTGMAPDAARGLALKLERQGLTTQAAQAWKDYLAVAEPDRKERAKIWYRIGRLLQEDGAPAEALCAYDRSESIQHLDELASELGRRIQECLEDAGKFSALHYELAERVGLGHDKTGDEVVAEIGKRKITRAEADRRIEAQIERQLTAMAAFLPEEERRRQKAEMLKRLSGAKERSRFVQELILEEILYRKAREDKLSDAPKVRALLRDTERSLLANQVLQKEIADHIHITPGDVRTYYEAHKQEYTEPEQARISHIQVKTKEEAEAVLKQLQAGTKFADLAKEKSIDVATRDKGGEIAGWVHPGGTIPGIGSCDRISKAVFKTKAAQVVNEPLKSDKGFHVIKVLERKDRQQRSFEAVRPQAYRALRQQKEREVRESLFARLKDRYNVVIHASRLHASASPSSKPKKDAKSSQSQQDKKAK